MLLSFEKQILKIHNKIINSMLNVGLGKELRNYKHLMAIESNGRANCQR
jgi:hypothetical protein